MSGDSRWLVTAGGRTVRVWDLAGGAPTAAPVVLREEATSTASGRRGARSRRTANPTPGISISPNSRWLVTAGDANTVRVRDLKAKDLTTALTILRGHKGPVYGAEFSPDARWLVTTASSAAPPLALGDVKMGGAILASFRDEVRLWDLNAKDPTAASVLLGMDRGQGIRTAFSRDGRWLATAASKNATVRLWDLMAKEPSAAPVVLRANVAISPESVETPVAVSADSRWVVRRRLPHGACVGFESPRTLTRRR